MIGCRTETEDEKRRDREQDRSADRKRKRRGRMTDEGGLGERERERYREAKKITAMREGGGGTRRDQDAVDGQHGPKGPGLTATPAVRGAGRM